MNAKRVRHVENALKQGFATITLFGDGGGEIDDPRNKFRFKFDPGPGAPPFSFLEGGRGGPGTWIEV